MSETNYQGRATHLDGTPIFSSREDTRGEVEVARLAMTAWDCQIHPFGELAPVDWFATRYGRMVGVLELKTRTHASDQYPTVFLNVRKWLALSLARVSFDTAAIFVVRFTDRILWTPVGSEMGSIRIAGHAVRRAASDVEPLIEVPVSAMRPL